MKPVRRLAPTLLLLLWGLALAACREGYPAGDEPTHAHPAGESAEVTALPPAARARAGESCQAARRRIGGLPAGPAPGGPSRGEAQAPRPGKTIGSRRRGRRTRGGYV